MVKQHGNMAWFAYLIPWEMNMVQFSGMVKQHGYMTWFAYLIPWEMNMVQWHG